MANWLKKSRCNMTETKKEQRKMIIEKKKKKMVKISDKNIIKSLIFYVINKVATKISI